MARTTFGNITSKALQTAALAALAVLASAASADATTNVGWVYANCPSCTVTYTPITSFSYSSVGGAISITPEKVGLWQVDFANMYDTGHLNNVQVTAADTSGYCTSAGWDTEGAGMAAQMHVACYDPSGNPSNWYWVLEYQKRDTKFGSATAGIAYFWANKPTASAYTPDPHYNYSSTGKRSQVQRLGLGSYRATIFGLSAIHSDVQVTAYNGLETKSPARCKVQKWASDGSGNTNIYVLCFDVSGAAADERYSLAYAVNEPFGLTGTSAGTGGAWAWAQCPSCTTTYSLAPNYQFNGLGTGSLSATKTATGRYTISIPGSGPFIVPDALATAYGSDSRYCNVYDWNANSIQLECFSQGGVPADSKVDAALQAYP